MKLMIEDTQILSVVHDNHSGGTLIDMPEDFDINSIDKYEVIDGVVILKKVTVITPRQCRLQLLYLGLLDEVEALLANDRAIQILWEYSLDIQRTHPMIIAMATQLGMSEEDIDNFFIEASKL